MWTRIEQKRKEKVNIIKYPYPIVEVVRLSIPKSKENYLNTLHYAFLTAEL